MGNDKTSSQTIAAPDPEMLNHLDLLMDIEVLRNEKDWTLLQEKTPAQEWEMTPVDSKNKRTEGNSND